MVRKAEKVSSALVLAALLALLSAAAPARASTVIGADLSGTPTFGMTCGNPPGIPCELTASVQGVAAGHRATGGETVSSPGVIVGWSVKHGYLEGSGGSTATASYLTADLRVIRGAGANGIGVGTGPAEQLPQAPGTYEFPARIPVQTGDRIGFDLRFAPGDLVLVVGVTGSGAGAGDSVGYSSIWPEGGSPGFYTNSSGSPTFVDAYLLVNATVEPDADGDGFGDETQDGCPASASTHGPCPTAAAAGPPAPAGTGPPDTRIVKRRARRSVATTAKFRFRSTEPRSTFECALKGKHLDKLLKRFHRCRSPRRYRDLEPGPYRFLVRAVDASGIVDPTPAKARFRVLASKRRRA